MPVPLKAVLAHVDLPELRAVAEHLLAAGRSRDQVIEDIVAAVDALVPWDAILPGPVGVAVEALDAPLATVIARLVVASAEKRRGGKRAA